MGDPSDVRSSKTVLKARCSTDIGDSSVQQVIILVLRSESLVLET